MKIKVNLHFSAMSWFMISLSLFKNDSSWCKGLNIYPTLFKTFPIIRFKVMPSFSRDFAVKINVNTLIVNNDFSHF